MTNLRETSSSARCTVRQADVALLTLHEIASTIDLFNDDALGQNPDHRDVTMGDVAAEFTRMANGGRDRRPKNEQAEEIVQQAMAELIHALEEAQEDGE